MHRITENDARELEGAIFHDELYTPLPMIPPVCCAYNACMDSKPVFHGINSSQKSVEHCWAGRKERKDLGIDLGGSSLAVVEHQSSIFNSLDIRAKHRLSICTL